MKRIISTPPNYFYGCIFVCIPFHFILSRFRCICFPYNLLGLPFIPLGIFMVINPWYLFQKHNTPENFSTSTSLVVEGIYKYSRNPMYLGGILILLGVALTTGNLVAFVVPVVFFLIMQFIFIPFEEEKMKSTFGKDYLKYKASVRRWI